MKVFQKDHKKLKNFFCPEICYFCKMHGKAEAVMQDFAACPFLSGNAEFWSGQPDPTETEKSDIEFQKKQKAGRACLRLALSF